MFTRKRGHCHTLRMGLPEPRSGYVQCTTLFLCIMKQLTNLAYSLSLALVTLIPTLKKRVQIRPRLIIEVTPTPESYSLKRWASTRNKDLYIYETCWRYLITIKNNTSFDACYPRISFDRTLPHYSRIGILNHYVPIFAKSETTIEGEYSILEECHEHCNTIPSGIPEALKHVNVLLEYRNEEKVKFYTVFGFKNRTNVFHRFKPSEFSRG